ncbi:DNA translocase FtsK [Methylobacterium sp. sgz302541]
MSLRASLTRRLAGLPQRPGYAVSGTRPAASWMTSPQAMLGREREFWQDEAQRGETGAAPDGWVREQAWPEEVFDDRASLDMLVPATMPESRIDASASGPGVLVRSPRRPASISPERPERLPPAYAPQASMTNPAVRYTRTPDTVLRERRLQAREAEQAERLRMEAAALAAAQAEEAELAARETEQAAATETALLAEREALAAAAAALTATPALPLWRQPFVAPPGVRFFRTPDRRAPAPRALPEPSRPEPQVRDWNDLCDWSATRPWFEGEDWSSVEAWAAIQGVSEPGPVAPADPAVQPTPEPAVTRMAVPVARRPDPARGEDGFVSVPLDISHLRSLPPAPAYALDRLVSFERTPRPADAQDNAARPVLALVPLAAAPPQPEPEPEPEPAPPAPQPVLPAMAARAAIRAAAPVQPAAPSAPATAALPMSAVPMSAVPMPLPSPLPARPVLLRTKATAPAAPEVPEAPAPVAPVAMAAPVEEPAPAREESPLPAPAFVPQVVAPRPQLISAGRHIGVASVENADYEHPELDLLALPPVKEDAEVDADVLEQNALNLQQTVQDFGVKGDILAVRPGPVVTLYELEPAPGTKSSRVIALADDIARSMSAVSARVAVVPGRNVIGIELPNDTRETVYLRELLASADFFASKHKLALCLGKNIGGEPIIADLARMPHLLVAGTTGSGKSVAINTMILSLLYRLKPEECRLIMVDPKMLELSIYDGIPHLLSPVVTDPKKAVIALKWAVREMEERYKKMSKLGVRNIDGFNARLAEARARGEVLTRTVQTGFDRTTGEAVYENEEMDLNPLPYIVIVVDEMADLMMVAGKDIEGAIQRLAQMARAAGIHLIMATQRPSVDVITGTIKANFPTRISFQVTSKIDSRTILGEMGAEQLLGQGDMLFMAGGGRTTRVHGPFCSDSEVESVVAHLKRQGRPAYLDAVTEDDGAEAEKPAKGAKAEAQQDEGDEPADVAVFDAGSFGLAGGEGGDLYEQAVQVVLRDKKASTSYIQRRLQIGYNRAASIMERMEIEGIVGQANHAGKREILVDGVSHVPSYDD